MTVGSVLLGVALALLVGAFAASPFFYNGRRRTTSPESPAPDSPDLAKQGALAALRDLDFDFRTGKVTEDDYAPLRQRLVAEAGQALQAAEMAAKPSPELDAEIEAAVHARRASTRARRDATCPHCQAPVSRADRFCPQCGKAMTATCPQCRRAVDATDKFCAGCGATLHNNNRPNGAMRYAH